MVTGLVQVQLPVGTTTVSFRAALLIALATADCEQDVALIVAAYPGIRKAKEINIPLRSIDRALCNLMF
jgi:hypothetical protein